MAPRNYAALPIVALSSGVKELCGHCGRLLLMLRSYAARSFAPLNGAVMEGCAIYTGVRSLTFVTNYKGITLDTAQNPSHGGQMSAWAIWANNSQQN